MNTETINGKAITATIYRLEGSNVVRASVMFPGSKKPKHYGSNNYQKLIDGLMAIDNQCVSDMERREKWKAERAEYKARMKQTMVEGIVPGALLHGSWGWEQTQCELFQVIEVNKSTATIRRIKSRDELTGNGMASNNWPLKDDFCGEPFKARIGPRGIKYSDYCYLQPASWDRSYYCSWYG